MCYRCNEPKSTIEYVGEHPPLCDDCWDWWRRETDLTGVNPYWELYYRPTLSKSG